MSHLHTEAKPRSDARPWLLLIAVVVVILDRLSKIMVAKHITMGSGKVIIPHVFRITHVLNTGAAFSMFAESASPLAVRVGLIIFSVVAALAVLFMLVRYGKHWSAASVGFALVLGGAIGNLYDRAVLHYVIDFLEVHIGTYHWPDFNVADSAISVGAVLLLVEMIWPSETAESASTGDANGDVLGA
ncbi:signal peptidase II [Terriglobus roseus]|uniref:Lipoprotein signal peptidase n=1 Tax=Terriglobus roseus TaxID=392734 RepID=A0A1H4IVL9_9BACT|nr:signal peptidase II [Terriglobus roseus]SEB37262.1 signal peptidase II Aspartic peptidase. MEROPS family A08 [Terriglobus roseus]